MQPRPMFPLQGGMRPPGPGFGGGAPMMRPGTGMFGGGRPMMGGARPGMYGGGRPMMGQGANPFGGMMGGRQMGRGGGLLSRLLGRGNQMGNMMGGPTGIMGATGRATGGGGLLQSLSNPGGIMNMLNNTQQIIRTAQTVAPMIQQYGPLVRSLPGLWKLYRGLKNSDGATDKGESNTKTAVAAEESSGLETKTGKSASRTSKKVTNVSEQKRNSAQRYHQQKGKSMPKLYI